MSSLTSFANLLMVALRRRKLQSLEAEQQEDVVYDGGFRVPGDLHDRLLDFQKTGGHCWHQPHVVHRSHELNVACTSGFYLIAIEHGVAHVCSHVKCDYMHWLSAMADGFPHASIMPWSSGESSVPS